MAHFKTASAQPHLSETPFKTCNLLFSWIINFLTILFSIAIHTRILDASRIVRDEHMGILKHVALGPYRRTQMYSNIARIHLHTCCRWI